MKATSEKEVYNQILTGFGCGLVSPIIGVITDTLFDVALRVSSVSGNLLVQAMVGLIISVLYLQQYRNDTEEFLQQGAFYFIGFIPGFIIMASAISQ